MPNHPNTDLDELLKLAYEKYDMGRETNSWESLSAVLDEHMPQKKDRRRGFLFFLFLFLMAGGATLFIFTGNAPHRGPMGPDSNNISLRETGGGSIRETSGGSIGETGAAPAGGDKSPGNESYADGSRGDGVRTDGAHADRAHTDGARIDRAHIDGARIDGSSVEGGRTDERQAYQPMQRKSTRPHRQSDRPSTDAELQPASASSDLPALSDISTPLAPLTTSVPPIVIKVVAPKDSALASSKTSKKLAPPKTKFFELGVLAGEDESNVKFKPNSRAGFNLGLLAEYSFSKRWSVASGVIYTWKNYMADGQDYHAPKDHFVNSPGVVLQKAASTCSMLDIPINLRYNISVTDKSKLFVTTGISSYLMLREVYTFYGTDSGTAFKRGLDGDEVLKKGFWFSVLNLSIGYEKSISKRLSFQAEPYVKIPLQGIGFGKVLMNSYGINFAIKMKYLHPNKSK